MYLPNHVLGRWRESSTANFFAYEQANGLCYYPAMPATPSIFAPRTPWPDYFPDVITHCTVKERDAHPMYHKAKAGDHAAAVALVYYLICTNAVEQIRPIIAERTPLLVPVGAIEKNGYNAIPSALADQLSQWLNLEVDTGELRQINKVGHTRAPNWQRMVTPALFSGEVQQGCDYLLVDDHVGAGGTLANLRGYIENKGGNVIAMTTLTASRDAEKISLSADMLNMLRLKYGEELDTFWQTHFGYGLDCLTAVEARDIYRQPSVDAIRRFIFKAADEADSGGITPVASLAGKAPLT